MVLTVHPHACGEYIVPRAAGSVLSGSSPRVWGIRRTYGGEKAS
ncbi:hypothetical protein DESPIG_00031 [Desulfovibrio piger ATCC 29098]|nr:hypothetical protein DESPIG_00031 [Desulfovibrio piger ATCC 29098]